MKTLKIFLNCIVFVILTLLISCKTELEPHNLVWSQTFGGSGGDHAKSVQQTADGGYILAGCTQSYGAGNSGDAWLVKTDATGVEQWSQTFGGSRYDAAESVQQTTDGGYILAGYSESYGAKSFGFGVGANDNAWLIKTDAMGVEQWSQTFGGSKDDYIYFVQQTTDGGYILAGRTESYGAVSKNAWLIKTDATGVEQWSQTFGGISIDWIYSVQQTTDGGYILAGWITSHGAENAWLIKTDAAGVEQWSQTFGGPRNDRVTSIQQTMDGDYILAGYTDSYGAGYGDAWLIKTDAAGVEQWSQTLGGSEDDNEVWSIQQTTDGGYILAGRTYSYNEDKTKEKPSQLSIWNKYDAWLIKTNAAGVEQWSQTFGGSGNDYAESIQQTMDGGYILAGYTDSYGAGYGDAWLIKISH